MEGSVGHMAPRYSGWYNSGWRAKPSIGLVELCRFSRW